MKKGKKIDKAAIDRDKKCNKWNNKKSTCSANIDKHIEGLYKTWQDKIGPMERAYKNYEIARDDAQNKYGPCSDAESEASRKCSVTFACTTMASCPYNETRRDCCVEAESNWSPPGCNSATRKRDSLCGQYNDAVDKRNDKWEKYQQKKTAHDNAQKAYTDATSKRATAQSSIRNDSWNYFKDLDKCHLYAKCADAEEAIWKAYLDNKGNKIIKRKKIKKKLLSESNDWTSDVAKWYEIRLKKYEKAKEHLAEMKERLRNMDSVIAAAERDEEKAKEATDEAKDDR